MPAGVFPAPTQRDTWCSARRAARDRTVARLKLDSMGVTIDSINDDQNEYMDSWEYGS
jgi:S-adenosylhomocysteine hydrolase